MLGGTGNICRDGTVKAVRLGLGSAVSILELQTGPDNIFAFAFSGALVSSSKEKKDLINTESVYHKIHL